jgi:hypothetical protein
MADLLQLLIEAGHPPPVEIAAKLPPGTELVIADLPEIEEGLVFIPPEFRIQPLAAELPAGADLLQA